MKVKDTSKFTGLCSDIFKNPDITPLSYTPSDLTKSKTQICYSSIYSDSISSNIKPSISTNDKKHTSHPLPLDIQGAESPFMINEEDEYQQQQQQQHHGHINLTLSSQQDLLSTQRQYSQQQQQSNKVQNQHFSEVQNLQSIPSSNQKVFQEVSNQNSNQKNNSNEMSAVFANLNKQQENNLTNSVQQKQIIDRIQNHSSVKKRFLNIETDGLQDNINIRKKSTEVPSSNSISYNYKKHNNNKENINNKFPEKQQQQQQNNNNNNNNPQQFSFNNIPSSQQQLDENNTSSHMGLQKCQKNQQSSTLCLDTDISPKNFSNIVREDDSLHFQLSKCEELKKKRKQQKVEKNKKLLTERNQTEPLKQKIKEYLEIQQLNTLPAESNKSNNKNNLFDQFIRKSSLQDDIEQQQQNNRLETEPTEENQTGIEYDLETNSPYKIKKKEDDKFSSPFLSREYSKEFFWLKNQLSSHKKQQQQPAHHQKSQTQGGAPGERTLYRQKSSRSLFRNNKNIIIQNIEEIRLEAQHQKILKNSINDTKKIDKSNFYNIIQEQQDEDSINKSAVNNKLVTQRYKTLKNPTINNNYFQEMTTHEKPQNSPQFFKTDEKFRKNYEQFCSSNPNKIFENINIDPPNYIETSGQFSEHNYDPLTYRHDTSIIQDCIEFEQMKISQQNSPESIIQLSKFQKQMITKNFSKTEQFNQRQKNHDQQLQQQQYQSKKLKQTRSRTIQNTAKTTKKNKNFVKNIMPKRKNQVSSNSQSYNNSKSTKSRNSSNKSKKTTTTTGARHVRGISVNIVDRKKQYNNPSEEFKNISSQYYLRETSNASRYKKKKRNVSDINIVINIADAHQLFKKPKDINDQTLQFNINL